MKSRAYIIIGVMLLLLASCGKQHSAEQTVKAFVEDNMENGGSDISGRDFADLGATKFINDSLIQLMRHRGAPLFKQSPTGATASMCRSAPKESSTSTSLPASISTEVDTAMPLPPTFMAL